MWFGMVTLFPELVASVMSWGVVARASEQNLLSVEAINPRQFTQDKHATVDAKPYGGSPGMLMQPGPLAAAIAHSRQRATAALGAAASDVPVIYLSPQGRPLDQGLVQELSAKPGLILLCGRYEGVDERLVSEAVDLEVSVGDYVVSGGELPALTLVDAVARCLPGVLGNRASIECESHLDGLLDYPQYTRPEIYDGVRVPKVLLSGDHGAIERWQAEQALLRTWLRRPDLLAHRTLSKQERAWLAAALKVHEEKRHEGEQHQENVND